MVNDKLIFQSQYLWILVKAVLIGVLPFEEDWIITEFLKIMCREHLYFNLKESQRIAILVLVSQCGNIYKGLESRRI